MTNDRDARDEIVEHVPALRAFARSLTQNPTRADDLVQDTIVRAWTKFDQFKEGTNLRAWLFTIQRNLFFSERRKAKWETQDTDGVHAGKLVQAPTQDARMDFADFMTAFAKLPDDQREALILIGASGFTYDEAAEIAGVATGTMKSRVNRGRQKLTELLGLEDSESISSQVPEALAVISQVSNG
jgi:RNA polymerase sigma-70 factor, ECF subfamily